MNRATIATLLLSCMAMSALFSTPLAFAEEKTIAGTITATKDDDGNITGVKLTQEDGTQYSVTMDEQGKKLGSLSGKKAKATGNVEEKDGRMWLTVASYKDDSGDN